MSKFVYKGRRKQSPGRILSYLLMGLIALWFIASIYLNKSPIDILKNGFQSVNTLASPSESIDALKKQISEKDSIISLLESKLAVLDARANKKAIVKVSGKTLNMRSKASLSSEIIMQIPTESEVDILFYDTETYYLDSKAGKWCKIRYSGQEGWVWGNFLLELN